ncbi:MAG: OmpH family outer membrane protein [Alphaproteobacteria bacterium]|nr:OmpH family outer membrane protein [Alphaproteobacteria bacterium]
MTRKMGTLLAGALAAFFLASPVSAADKPPAPIILVVDYDLAVRSSTAFKGIRAEQNRYAQTYEAELQREETALRDAEKELAKQRSVLSPEAFAERVKNFEKQVAGIRGKVVARRRALDRSYSQAMQQLTKALLELTFGVAQERGANLVLAKAQVVFLDPAMEITKDVVDRLNAKLTSVPFPPPTDAPPPAQGAAKPPAAPAKKK